MIKHGHNAPKSNGVSPTYNTWHAMKKRCTNPNHKSYKYYGGRGISICERWNDFEKFLEDMGERPDGLTIERVNNDLDYNKENCVWATGSEQQRNKRGSLTSEQIFEICKSSLSQRTLAKQYGVSQATISNVKARQ